MTVPGWGRVNSIQKGMLLLADLIRSDFAEESTDEQAKASIVHGRALLVKMTGCDFGYDVLAWHNYLINSPDASSYCYEGNVAGPSHMHASILATARDARRIRLVEEIVTTDSTGPPGK